MRAWLALAAVLLAFACRLSAAYLLIATEDDPPGHVLFNASLGGRGVRTYSINNHRSASFVHRLLRVDSATGRISLRNFLDCTAVYYPNLFTLHVDSVAVADPVDYYSLPLRVFVSGRRCERDPLVSIDLADEAEEADVALNRVHVKVSEAKRWVSETLASYAIPNAEAGEAADWTRICLRQSQLVCRIRNLLPSTVVSNFSYYHCCTVMRCARGILRATSGRRRRCRRCRRCYRGHTHTLVSLISKRETFFL